MAINSASEYRVLSRPVGIHWAGWRSDTLELQRAGWELAVHNEEFDRSYCLVMNHPALKLQAFTDRRTLESPTSYQQDLSRAPVFQVTHIARSLHVANIPAMDLSVHDFRAIDAQPAFTQRRIESFDDTNYFNLRPQKIEQLLIDKADMTVIEHLEAIKKLQQPKQHELRMRNLEGTKERIGPKLHIVAQLVHMEQAA